MRKPRKPFVALELNGTVDLIETDSNGVEIRTSMDNDLMTRALALALENAIEFFVAHTRADDSAPVHPVVQEEKS